MLLDFQYLFDHFVDIRYQKQFLLILVELEIKIIKGV